MRYPDILAIPDFKFGCWKSQAQYPKWYWKQFWSQYKNNLLPVFKCGILDFLGWIPDFKLLVSSWTLLENSNLKPCQPTSDNSAVMSIVLTKSSQCIKSSNVSLKVFFIMHAWKRQYLTKSTCTHILRHALVCSSIKCLSRQSLITLHPG